MTASQMRIAETIDAFYGDAGTNDGVSRSYKQAVEDLDAETIKALDGPYRYVLHLSLGHGGFLFIKLTFAARPSSNQYRDSVPTFPTSTNASRKEITNYSITMRCGPKSRNWSTNQTKTPPSYLEQKKRRKWRSRHTNS